MTSPLTLPPLSPWLRFVRRLKDLAITLLLWVYFTAGFVVFFSPFYLLAFLFSKERTVAFQAMNSRFFRSFFWLCRFLIPRQHWQIDPEIQSIRSSVVLCNHVSYLDSIFLISLFPRHTTIAKARLFDIPVFGRILALSGYIPSSSEGPYSTLFLNSLDNLAGHLADGGNVVVFPEGRRSRNGRVGPLHKGIFKIARHCNAAITILGIRNTEKLFEPGKFLFDTDRSNTIRVERITEFHPDYANAEFSIKDLMGRVSDLLTSHVVKK